MANGIKYGTTAQDGALRKGNVQFTVSPAEFGPSSSSGYYAGINPPSGGYVVYKVVNGGTPIIFGAPNNDALVYILRQLTGTAYTYPAEAMNDVATNHPTILVMNKNFPPMITTGAQVVLDASFTGCYPLEDLKFYNIGAGQGYADLLNGAHTFDNNVAFSLDGGDDDIRISGNLGAGSTATVVLWLKTTDPTFVWMSGQTSGHYVGATGGYGPWYDGAVGSPTYYVNTQSSYSPKSPFDSTDDRFHMFEAKNVDLSTWNDNHIAAYPYATTYSIYGQLSKFAIYTSPLTEKQSQFNYYGGYMPKPDDLVMAIDAGNILSFDSTTSGLAKYEVANLKTKTEIGSLANSVSFYSPNNQGQWVFDGVDDYISLGNTANLGTGDFTISAWVKIGTAPGNYGHYKGIVNKKPAGGYDAGYSLYYNTGYEQFLWSTADGASAVEIWSSNTFARLRGTWAHVVMVRKAGASPSQGYFYVNGVYESIGSSPSIVNVNNGNDLVIGGGTTGSGGFYLDGSVSNVQIWSTALSHEDIVGLYNSNRDRFQPVNASGGTISTANGYKIHTFTGDGTFTVNNVAGGYAQVEVLVVAGGGGTGYDVGGGGGGGGLVYQAYTVTPGAYAVTVGGGGPSGQTASVAGTNGSNSTFGIATAIGGGGGGTYPSGQVNGLNGGSGGGGGNYSSVGGSGTPGQGYNGGNSAVGFWGSGGGGGAKGPGENSIVNTPVLGGLGITSDISGANAVYSGGGYGNADSTAIQATGYNYYGTQLGYYGFGANGTGSPNNSPHSGNAGIVIVRYRT